ncbi:MAG: pantetheine-phosphate adenylyltransferase [Chloroflexi bacterium]|nr:pantetheine-phosphate adenylyltransferase [Chloroflexota bacterium]
MRQVFAVYPGTFDPVTNGHLDILVRARRLFGSIVVGIGRNPAKKPVFSIDQRVIMLQEALNQADIDKVDIIPFDGLTADFAREIGARAIVRALRSMTDFESEFALDIANARLAPELETVLLIARPEYTHLSSTLVREAAEQGRRIIPGSVPPCVEHHLREHYGF